MLLLNAREVPVLSVDTDGMRLPPTRLTAEALRAHFDQAPAWEPEVRGERPFTDRPLMPSAVLMGLVMRESLTVLLTRRASHLTDHAGQISFPGGRVEPQDRGAVATALREAQEEVGLPPELVQPLGCLPDYTTGTGYVVTPVVGLVSPRYQPAPDADEVAEVFEVPLSFLMTPTHHRQHEADWAGQRRLFWSMHWLDTPEPGGEGYFIWGATAAMLRNLYRFLASRP